MTCPETPFLLIERCGASEHSSSLAPSVLDLHGSKDLVCMVLTLLEVNGSRDPSHCSRGALSFCKDDEATRTRTRVALWCPNSLEVHLASLSTRHNVGLHPLPGQCHSEPRLKAACPYKAICNLEWGSTWQLYPFGPFLNYRIYCINGNAVSAPKMTSKQMSGNLEFSIKVLEKETN